LALFAELGEGSLLLLLAVLEGSEADAFVLLVEAFDALLTEESAEDVVALALLVELEGSEDLALLVEYVGEEVVDLLLLVLELSSFRPPDFELLAEAEADALELLEYSVGVYVGEDVLLLLLELSSRRLEDLELLEYSVGVYVGEDVLLLLLELSSRRLEDLELLEYSVGVYVGEDVLLLLLLVEAMNYVCRMKKYGERTKKAQNTITTYII